MQEEVKKNDELLGQFEEEEASTDEHDLIEAEELETVSEDKVEEPDWKDAYIRLAADFDNYRKRSHQEFDSVKRYERERVMNAWLDVYDATERAIANLPEKEGPWYEGFISLLKQMNRSLLGFNIKPMDCLGSIFDPKFHDAIATLPQPGSEDNTIIHVEKRGFIYENGDVMRVASVVVAKNS